MELVKNKNYVIATIFTAAFSVIAIWFSINSYINYGVTTYLTIILCSIGVAATILLIKLNPLGKKLAVLFWMLQTVGFGNGTYEYGFSTSVAINFNMAAGFKNYLILNVLAIILVLYTAAKVNVKNT